MDIKAKVLKNVFTDITDNSVVRKYFGLVDEFEELENYIKANPACDYRAIIMECIDELGDEFSQYRIFLCSFLIIMDSDTDDVELLMTLVKAPSINIYNKLFISNQILRLHMLNPEKYSDVHNKYLYDEFYKYYHGRFKDVLRYIPKERRHKDRVLVLTSQFLGERHAPTRTTLERCETLIKSMNKEVMCINTREAYNELGFLPFYKFTLGEIEENYNGKTDIKFNDTTFSLYQPEYNPLVPGNLIKLLEQIYEYAPERIVVIGNRSIIGDLCADIVPTVCIPLVFSEINSKSNQYIFTAGNYIGDNPAVIKGTFTFALNPQIKQLTRAELNLPEDRFILVIVGIRLDYDVDDKYIEYIKKTFKDGTFIVFAGCFDRYKEMAERDPKLRDNSAYLGYQNDILALMECCDLYVNSYRLGGGFSIAEAFCKGVPGVTIDYGDIAAAAGKDFCVNSYDEMITTIRKYIANKDFYKVMSEKALVRYKELTDSTSALQYIFNEMDRRNLF